MKDISTLLIKKANKEDCSVLNALLLLMDTTIQKEEENVRILQSKSAEEISGRLRDKSRK